MSQSLSRVVVHAIYSTKGRASVLYPELREELFPYLASALKNDGHLPIKVGGHIDHVHLLFGLSRTVTIAKAIENTKVSSSKWLKSAIPTFSWQGGYAAFGVSEGDVHSVVHYVSNQDSHHAEVSFQDELRNILKEHGIAYDEKYLWD